MYFVKRNIDFKSISVIVRFVSLARKTHYEILNLRRNCTEKEIKDAFIQMSKTYHPDKNKDSRAQDKFVRIVEAYNVLSKPSSRARYDSITQIHVHTAYEYKPHESYNFRHNPNYNYGFAHQKTGPSNTNTNTNDTAGVVKKIPNYAIIVFCCGVALVGLVLQMFVIRNMYIIQRRQAQEKSKYLAEELEKVRNAASTNGNELQSRLLLDKIVAAANPTVATASLGQALANEKKDNGTLLKEFEMSEEDEWSRPSNEANMKAKSHNIIRYILSIYCKSR